MVKDIFRIEIEMEQELSPDSKKISTEYYELKVQIRFKYFSDLKTNKKDSLNYNLKDNYNNLLNDTSNDKSSINSNIKTLYDIKKEVFDLVTNNFDAINKFEDLNNGFDFYFRNLNDIYKVSRFFSKRYFISEKRTKKVVGMDYNTRKNISRHTLLILILNLNKGDLVSIKGEEFFIKNLKNNELILINKLNGSKKVVNYDKVSDYFKVLVSSGN